jgi:molybdate transport system regulatory protein
MHVNLWIENPQGELLFGEGRLQILQAIEEHGTLSAAAEALGMSYRGLWARVRHSERRLGFPLIESRAGRGPESGTSLTAEGHAIMERYARLLTQTQTAAQTAFAEIFVGGG